MAARLDTELTASGRNGVRRQPWRFSLFAPAAGILVVMGIIAGKA